MAPSSTEAPRRRLGRLLLGLLALGALCLGIRDMGLRVDEQVLSLGECLQDSEACKGEQLNLAYLKVGGLEADHTVLTGLGSSIRVYGLPPLPSSTTLVRVSVAGTYQGAGALKAERVSVHRFRYVKELVGQAVVLLWLLGVARFCLRRFRG